MLAYYVHSLDLTLYLWNKTLNIQEVEQGRNQMYKLLLDSDVTTVFLTKGYIKDCTNDLATNLGKGAFGASFYGEDKENSKLKYVVKKAMVTLHTDDALDTFKEIMQRDIAVCPFLLDCHQQ